MAKNSALNIDVTPGGSATITFPSVTGTLATLAGTEALSNKTLTLASGTTATAPLKMTSGTNLTTATAGALEYDGKVFYATPVAGARGVNINTMYSIITSGNFALSTATGVQSCFPAAGDVWTLEASTSYFFEGQYQITKSGTTTTLGLAFALAGGATITKINYWAMGQINAKNTTTTTQSTAYVDQVAVTSILATGTVGCFVQFNGIIRMNAGGTVTPQISFMTGSPTSPTMIAGSYIAFTPIGSNTQDQQGNVA